MELKLLSDEDYWLQRYCKQEWNQHFIFGDQKMNHNKEIAGIQKKKKKKLQFKTKLKHEI